MRARATEERNGAERAPFSLAAYIILPIEGHTSFPLYVSIYNSPRNICSSRSPAREGDKPRPRAGPVVHARVGSRATGRPDDRPRLSCLRRGIDVLRPTNNASYRHDGRPFPGTEPTCPSRLFASSSHPTSPLSQHSQPRSSLCVVLPCFSLAGLATTMVSEVVSGD